MTDPKSTHDLLKQLTPRETKVLRERFGIVDDPVKSSSTTPTKGDDEDGSGGVPAPAKPPS